MITGNQKQALNLFQQKNEQEQAEEIAQKCNQLGITKEQLQGIIGTLSRR